MQNVVGTRTRRPLLVGAAAVVGFGAPAAGAQQADDPSTTESSAVDVAAELSALRQALTLHTLRLDEAEQTLARQEALINRQAAMIDRLEAALAASGGALGPLAEASTPGGEYFVKSGDTLSLIAQRLNLDPFEIQRANGLPDADRIYIGQRLLLPEPMRFSEAPSAETAAQLAAVGQRSGGASDAAPAETAQNQADAPERPAPTPGEPPPPPTPKRVAVAPTQRREADAAAQEALPEEVGQRPEEEEQPYLALFSDVGGILTPRGTLLAEPEFGFTTTSDNRFIFNGVQIVDAILVGLIGSVDATDTDRRALSSRFGMRYGLTNRLELEGRVSHVYRDEQIAGVPLEGDPTLVIQNQTGSGFGDVEAGVHYQLNNGGKFPYTIFNLRARAPTGRGPFDLARNDNNVETELATGSGFWTIEPSLTFIAPSAPASIFANIGYQANLTTSPNLPLGDRTLLEFDPGDSIRANIGVGLSLNDRFSLNFGYNQSHFFKSKSRFNNFAVLPIDPDGDGPEDAVDTPVSFFTKEFQSSATIGSFGFGGSYAVSDSLRVNVNTAIGATDESPDLQFSIRLQKRLFD